MLILSPYEGKIYIYEKNLIISDVSRCEFIDSMISNLERI